LTGLVANKVVLTLKQEFGVFVEGVSSLLTGVTAQMLTNALCATECVNKTVLTHTDPTGAIVQMVTGSHLETQGDAWTWTSVSWAFLVVVKAVRIPWVLLVAFAEDQAMFWIQINDRAKFCPLSLNVPQRGHTRWKTEGLHSETNYKDSKPVPRGI